MAWKYKGVEVCNKEGDNVFADVFVSISYEGGNEAGEITMISVQDPKTGKEIEVYDNELDGIREHIITLRKQNPGEWAELSNEQSSH